jgi:hypothetical protein
VHELEPGERGSVFLCMLTYSNQIHASVCALKMYILRSSNSTQSVNFPDFNVFFGFRELLIERNRGQHVQSYPE